MRSQMLHAPGAHAGRPRLADVRLRYLRLHDDHGHPHYLPDLGLEPRLERGPDECRGACTADSDPERTRPCFDAILCAFCNERKARQNAVKIAILHTGRPNLNRISIPLPGVTDTERGREALTKIARSLRGAGFDRLSLWLHVFGHDPRNGPEPHVEGVISGTDPDVDVLDPQKRRSALARTIRGFLPTDPDGIWPVQIHHHSNFHPHSRHHVRDLLRVGLDVGRPSLDVRRVHAGLYRTSRGDLRVRYTDVHERCRPTHVHDVAGPNPCDDWRQDDLERALRIAHEWRTAGLRPRLTTRVHIPDGMLQLVMDNAPGSRYYRIPTAEVLRRRSGGQASKRRT